MGEPVKNEKEEVKIFSEYASFYDILYQDKDYEGEAKFIVELIKKFANKDFKDLNVLDIGCGTGKHAIQLKNQGFNIDGCDISGDMLSIARETCLQNNVSIDFFNESFQTLDRIERKYDIILSMFSSINYLISFEDIKRSIKNISSLLKDDGYFIFDFWNGDAVINFYSPVKVKRIKKDNKEIIRISETSLNRNNQIANVEFSFILIDNSIVVKDYKELHSVRYFFIQEMKDVLFANGLKVIYTCPFMSPDKDISSSDWNISFIVKKM